MADVLELARHDDAAADVDSLSLLNFTSGINLADNGWQQAIAGDNDASVVESLSLFIRGATHDALATNLQALDLKIRQVGFYHNKIEKYAVWLRVKLTGETGGREALILSAKRSPAPLWSYEVRNPIEGNYYLLKYTLALTRMPYWEDPTFTTGWTSTSMSSVGGTYTYGAVTGDVPPRMYNTQIQTDGVSGTGSGNKIWMGFRSPRFGTIANFLPTWSLRKGAAFDADTTGGTTNSHSEAKDGKITITTFATVATMLRRVTIRVSDVTSNYSDQRGTYLVLLRAALSTSGVVRARLADGLYSSPKFNTRPRVLINATNFKMYEMGTVQIPSPARYSTKDLAPTYALAIEAERISGSAALWLDTVILIPIDEALMTVDMGDFDATQAGFVFVSDLPDGSKAGFYQFSTPIAIATPRLTAGIPVGASGLIVFAAQRSTVSVLADTHTVDIHAVRRWVTLRGAV
jgi:hypothetical protein